MARLSVAVAAVMESVAATLLKPFGSLCPRVKTKTAGVTVFVAKTKWAKTMIPKTQRKTEEAREKPIYGVHITGNRAK